MRRKRGVSSKGTGSRLDPEQGESGVSGGSRSSGRRRRRRRRRRTRTRAIGGGGRVGDAAGLGGSAACGPCRERHCPAAEQRRRKRGSLILVDARGRTSSTSRGSSSSSSSSSGGETAPGRWSVEGCDPCSSNFIKCYHARQSLCRYLTEISIVTTFRI